MNLQDGVPGVGFDGHFSIGLNLQSITWFLFLSVATNGYAALASAFAISLATSTILSCSSGDSRPSRTSISRSALCLINSAFSSEIGVLLASVRICATSAIHTARSGG